jgi:hypothetical protein
MIPRIVARAIRETRETGHLFDADREALETAVYEWATCLVDEFALESLSALVPGWIATCFAEILVALDRRVRLLQEGHKLVIRPPPPSCAW